MFRLLEEYKAYSKNGVLYDDDNQIIRYKGNDYQIDIDTLDDYIRESFEESVYPYEGYGDYDGYEEEHEEVYMLALEYCIEREG